MWGEGDGETLGGLGPSMGGKRSKGLMFLALLGKAEPAFSVAYWLCPGWPQGNGVGGGGAS